MPLDQGLPGAAVFVDSDSPQGVARRRDASQDVSPDPGFGPFTTRKPSSPPRRIKVLLSPLATSWNVPAAQTVSSETVTPQRLVKVDPAGGNSTVVHAPCWKLSTR